MPNDDVTDNIELICPSNSYSSTKFVKQKQTLVLIKQEDSLSRNKIC